MAEGLGFASTWAGGAEFSEVVPVVVAFDSGAGCSCPSCFWGVSDWSSVCFEDLISTEALLFTFSGLVTMDWLLASESCAVASSLSVPSV